MGFSFTRLAIPAVVLVTPSPHRDGRGFLMEAYRRSAFAGAGIDVRFVQENRSRSAARVLRGLHYQAAPFAQAKLVSCTAGSIFDAAVDLRRGSPTFGRHVATTLSADAHALLYVPAGFAHGFAALSDGAEVAYLCSEEYSPAHDRGIRWDDPDLAIPWPFRDPVVSDRDAALPLFKDALIDA